MAEDADEVKVFRGADDEGDLDLEDQSTQAQEIDGDKNDIVIETELEVTPGTKPGGAFSKPQPSPASFLPGMMPQMFNSPGAYAQMMLGSMMMNPAFMRPPMAAMSPSFMPYFGSMPMSPSFMNMAAALSGAPISPLYAAMANTKLDSVPLPANMQMMRGNPLNQMNQMRLPYGGSPISALGQNMQQDGLRRTREGKVKKEDHIKKPLNAFMWFMKENRPKMINENGFKEKQSAELNKELGKRWHALTKDEQQKYFKMAKDESELHKQKYPQWSARENYAVHKRKKRRRDKADDSVESKKCRARFGTNNTHLWCKFCKRKKKCEYASISYPGSDGGMSSDQHDRASGSSGPSPMTSSSMGGPSPIGMDHSSMEHGSDSDAEIDNIDADDDPTLTHIALQEAANNI